MIWIRKVKKSDLPILMDFKLKAILPTINSSKEKLLAISEVNKSLGSNYNEDRFIYNNLKLIGACSLKNNEIDLLYIKDDYKDLESKVRNKLNKSRGKR